MPAAEKRNVKMFFMWCLLWFAMVISSKNIENQNVLDNQHTKAYKIKKPADEAGPKMKAFLIMKP
ncbi:MAG: hypothetical protein Fur0041_01710 [Bacteroidia bacterium]